MLRITLSLMIFLGGTAITCKAHEVTWKTEAGSEGGGTVEPGPVGESVYFVCDVNREERADELVRTRFAPVYDQHVANGGLTSWGWLSHDTESEYRRLLKVTASDWVKLLEARLSILGAINDMDSAKEFHEICYSHVDNMWDSEQEKL